MSTLDSANALLPQGPFLWPFLFGAGIYGIRYLVPAGIAFAAWYGRRNTRGKLQRAMPQGGQIRRQIAYSILPVLILALLDAVLFGYRLAPHSQLYWNAAQYR